MGIDRLVFFILFPYDMPLLTGDPAGLIACYTFPPRLWMIVCPGSDLVFFFDGVPDGWMAVASVFRVIERQSNTHLIDVHIR